MRTSSSCSLALPALALACLPLAYAQQPTAEAPAATLKIQASEVVLPVTVRDKHGALITTLGIGDFSLTEDGRPQVIKSFTRESNLPFRLGLLVDTSHSVAGAMENERKAAGSFVDKMLPADPKAGTAGSNHISRCISLTGQAAYRMAETIKIIECLLLYNVKQLRIGNHREFIRRIDSSKQFYRNRGWQSGAGRRFQSC